MAVHGRRPLGRIIRHTKDPVGLSVLAIIYWVSSIDGRVSSEERAALQRVATAATGQSTSPRLVSALEGMSYEEIVLCADIVRRGLSDEQKILFLQMAIGMAVSDRFLRASENHALRFLADLLSVSPTEFEQIYYEVTGRAFATPGDPSSHAWWESAERRASTSDAESEHTTRPPPTSSNRRREALAVLGLGEHATTDEIRSAFRRLSHIHHPDRFHSLGPAAVATAKETFTRIRSAYELLIAERA